MKTAVAAVMDVDGYPQSLAGYPTPIAHSPNRRSSLRAAARQTLYATLLLGLHGDSQLQFQDPGDQSQHADPGVAVDPGNSHRPFMRKPMNQPVPWNDRGTFNIF